ncbi:MAG: hypothetical protein K0S27_355 [Gammaproteobacteria bacterium]|jgi:hypothetical protein|nr:hypothetical protein [Gammaproteobacteria bacterium]
MRVHFHNQGIFTMARGIRARFNSWKREFRLDETNEKDELRKGFTEHKEEEKAILIQEIREKENAYLASVNAHNEAKELNASKLRRAGEVVPEVEQEKPAYGQYERDFVRQYISQEVRAANTVAELNKIYAEHADRLYVKQHRFNEPIKKQYTRTMRHLINALRKRAEELYKEIPEHKEGLDKHYPLPSEQKRQAEQLLQCLEAERYGDSHFSARGEKSRDDNAEGGNLTAKYVLQDTKQKDFLTWLREREVELPKAEFNAKHHDQWAWRFVVGGKDAIKYLLRPVLWVFTPPQYNAAQKAHVRAHLREKIADAKNLQQLLDLYNLYQDTEFVKETRHCSSLFTRSYSTTRIEFLNAVRKRAVAILDGAESPQLREEDWALLQKKIQERADLLAHDLFSKRHEGLIGGADPKLRLQLEATQSEECALAAKLTMNPQRGRVVV